MKKLLVCLFACIVLVGCGKEEDTKVNTDVKKETKVCTMDVDGMDAEVKLDAEDDVITFMTMEMKSPDLGLDGVEITDEFVELIKEQMLKEMDIDEGKGVDIDVEMQGQSMSIVVKIDMKDGNPLVLNKLGLGLFTDHKLSEVLDEAKEEGITCK